MATDLSQDIRDRTFEFACAIVSFALELEANYKLRSILDQLLRSATSVGANLEEAKAASSKRDFLRYAQISLRESREASYWLRICVELGLGSEAALKKLCGESDQISRIVGAIVVSTKRRMLAGYAVFAFCILHFEFCISALVIFPHAFLRDTASPSADQRLQPFLPSRLSRTS
jgi:four helix bundle protein